jgi:hypothetical protein
MTSLLQPPSAKARTRALSIPTLMSLEEENNYTPTKLTVNANNDNRKYSDSSLPSATITQKSKQSRRSSLGFGLLGGKTDANGKRRSSIAVVFLGRRNSKVRNENTKLTGCLDTFQERKKKHFHEFTVEGADSRKSGKISTKIV